MECNITANTTTSFGKLWPAMAGDYCIHFHHKRSAASLDRGSNSPRSTLMQGINRIQVNPQMYPRAFPDLILIYHQSLASAQLLACSAVFSATSLSTLLSRKMSLTLLVDPFLPRRSSASSTNVQPSRFLSTASR